MSERVVDDTRSGNPEEFGYREELRREFSVWSAFSLGFVAVSPIVALYTIFGLGLTTGGPAFWWGFPIVLAGQLLVALVFAELVSRFPLEGSVYQWSRRLMGNGFGWFAGYTYICTIVITIATLALGGATYLAPLLGFAEPTNATLVLFALAILAVATAANTIARSVLKVVIVGSIVAEVVVSVVVGTVLLLFHRENSIGVIFDAFGTAAGDSSSYIFPFLASLAFVSWTFLGFESAGAVAEEVREPERAAPKAIVLSLVAVAIVVTYAALGLLLAIPDLEAVVAGGDADPIPEILTAQLGAGIATPLFALIVVGFLSAVLAFQTSVSRLIWAFARDRALPASGFLGRLSGNDRLPVNAILVVGVLAALLFLLSRTNLYATLVGFTIGGFYISFTFPVVAALVARVSGRWQEGAFSLGRAGTAVTVGAAIWLLFAIVNIAWPRAVELPWYENWAITLMVAVLGVVGTVIFVPLRGRIYGMVHGFQQPTGDAAGASPDGRADEPHEQVLDRQVHQDPNLTGSDR